MNSTGLSVAVVALIVGIGLGYVIWGGAASSSSSVMSTEKEVALYTTMRKLWTDHVVWTRQYIVAAVDDRPEAQQAAQRLLKNQEDIGNAVAGYYGKEAGDALTALLKEHITIAVDFIAAAKANDTAKVNDASARWDKNAEDIADFLSEANPNWPKAVVLEMLKKHLATTLDEVTARLKKDYVADVKAFDVVFDHINEMADALSAGIVAQFPDKFK